MKSPQQTALIAFLSFLHVEASLARGSNRFRHEAVNDLPKRNAIPPLEVTPSNITISDQCIQPTAQVLTKIFPSPGAPSIDITSQSQVVTSYITDFTWCVNGPLGLIPTATLLGPPYLNESTMFATTAGSGTCETVYVPTATTVCATTLTALATKITVSECEQQITFSSECGFTLETPEPTTTDLTALITPAPTVKRMVTYWLAPWQSLTLGETPSDVDIKICTIFEDDQLECIRYQEVWEVIVTTQTITTERYVELATTVSGPGALIIGSLQAFITDTIAYVDLSTTLLLQTVIETESTSRSKKLVTRPDVSLEPTSTVYVTKNVKYRSTSIPEQTTVIRVTSAATQLVDILTITKPRPSPTLLDIVPLF